MAGRTARFPAIAVALAVAIGACQTTDPMPDPTVVCPTLDLDGVRDSLKTLPGWTATTRGTLERAGTTVLDQGLIVAFVRPDQMMVEVRAGNETTSREWFLGTRAWLAKAPGLPDQNGIVFPQADRKRASRMPLADVSVPGKFGVPEPDSPGPCVLTSDDGKYQVFATTDGVYAGERRTGTMAGGIVSATVTFDRNVPVIPRPPTPGPS